jgi:preprotein translocase subunit SecA
MSFNVNPSALPAVLPMDAVPVTVAPATLDAGAAVNVAAVAAAEPPASHDQLVPAPTSPSAALLDELAAARSRRAAPWQLQQRAAKPHRLLLAAVKAVREHQAEWLSLSAVEESALRAALRARLVGQGFSAGLRDEVLACVVAKAERSLGRKPFDVQILCAQGMLDGMLVELASGEGKTLAVAMAAAAYALSGEAVHVLTTSDYLAVRDARQHAALFVGLGLRVGIVTAQSTPAQRCAAYAADVVYASARQVAADHLREARVLSANGQAHERVLESQKEEPWFSRGLSCAFVDDADLTMVDDAAARVSLDEAYVDTNQHAACRVALALARRVVLDVDAMLDVSSFEVAWTDVGRARMALLDQRVGGGWLLRADREALTGLALTALHALLRDHDYLIVDGQIRWLPSVPAQPEGGRPLSRNLMTLVELKEGLQPTPERRTVEQTCLQPFLRRYRWLAGTSATLSGCQTEITSMYGLTVMPVQPTEPSERLVLGDRAFAANSQRESATVDRILALHTSGRPVLAGVSGPSAAQALSAALTAAGVVHQCVLGDDPGADAECLALAGQRGAVTVLAAGAGRGADTPLGAEVTALGGLHVLDLMDTPCARERHRLLGRSARRGLPGSGETWHAADLPCWDSSWLELPAGGAPQWTVQAVSRMQQLTYEWTRRRQRRALLADEPAQS